MPDAATLTALVQFFGPLGALAIMIGYGLWQKAPAPPADKPMAQAAVSKEYEKTMGATMARIADTLEAQTAILDKIERQLLVLINRN